MRAGALRFPVVIHTPTMGQSSVSGEPVVASWSTINTHCDIETLKGYEAFRAQQREARVDTKIVLRYRTGINAQSIAVVNGSTYQVEGIVNTNEDNRQIELTCYKVTT